MDFSTSVAVLAILLAVPFSIAANLLTPRLQTWWATTNEKRKHKRIAKLERELGRLKGIPDKADAPTAATTIKGPKQPILKRGTFQAVGIGNPQARQLGFDAPEGFALFVQNAEKRYETRAHNLKADLKLQSADGKEIHVECAPWFMNTSSAISGKFFFESVTIGMLETAGVVCIIKRELAFYEAIYDGTNQVTTGRQVPFGEWTMTVKIEGDNCVAAFQGKLELLPNGSVGFAPIDPAPDFAIE